MEEYMKAIRDKLLYIMGAEEYTNAEMAQKCGISKRKLEEIIYGEKKGIYLETLYRISKNTKISISELLEGGNIRTFAH